MDTDVGSVPIAALYLQPPKSLQRSPLETLFFNYVKSGTHSITTPLTKRSLNHLTWLPFSNWKLASLSLSGDKDWHHEYNSCRPAVAAARLRYIHISEEQNEISKWEITFVRRGTGTKRCPGHQ